MVLGLAFLRAQRLLRVCVRSGEVSSRIVGVASLGPRRVIIVGVRFARDV